ncbi:hypothetical protein [Micromonospora thermarum]|uniref:DUF2154 domain-containing protein n=1 Tax=Micromonospora thermarum TaxID=2720024 RepID=A0ABX0ZHX8_9ACTN|nr:hypothetical protein [Micromonospora thermarum]NJP35558.1 hypothetical protein [Micromonospora thermarum]
MDVAQPTAIAGAKPIAQATPITEATPVGADDGQRPSWPYAGRLLVAAALVVLALGALAVVATVSDPHRLGLPFTAGGRAAGPALPVAEPGGAGAADAPESGDGDAASGGRDVLTAARDGRQRATFELAGGLTRLDLRMADLGDDLYRMVAPADGALVPRPEVLGDRVRLGLAPTGRSGPAAVEVVLNARVTWRLRLAGAVTEQRLDLSAARLAGVDLVGGATRTDLRLPRIGGTLTVRVSGGVTRLDVLVPGQPAVRVRAAAGAGSIAVGDERTDRVGAGTVLGSAGWDRAADRVYVDLVASADAVTVTAG